MTPRQFQNYYTGYSERKENDFREGWRQSRFIGFWSAIGHLKKGTKPDKLIEFPWDKEEQEIETDGIPSKAEIEATKAYWAEADKKRGESSN